jgi:hypothetical protein
MCVNVSPTPSSPTDSRMAVWMLSCQPTVMEHCGGRQVCGCSWLLAPQCPHTGEVLCFVCPLTCGTTSVGDGVHCDVCGVMCACAYALLCTLCSVQIVQPVLYTQALAEVCVCFVYSDVCCKVFRG